MLQEQASSSQPRVPAVTLRKEYHIPANAFTLNSAGKVQEGIEVEIDHPMGGKQPLLMLGEHWLPSDRSYPCRVVEEDSKVMARHLAIKTVQLSEGRKPLRLLTQPQGSNGPLLLFVDPAVSLPRGAMQTANFWKGVGECPLIVSEHYKSGQTLLAFPKDGDSASVFYSDGRVLGVVRRGNILETVQLPLEEQAERRIRIATNAIKKAEANLKGENLVRVVDVLYHMLADVLAVGGKRSETVFEKISTLLLAAGEQGRLRLGVQNHVQAAFHKVCSTTALEFVLACERANARKEGNGAFGNVSLPSLVAGPKGPPPSARAKQAKRSARDREERDRRRGSSQEIPLHQNGGRNSKKK